MPRRFPACVLTAVVAALWSASARAQDAPLRAAPPPEAKALVEAPKGPADAPKIERPVDGTTVALSTGGLLTTGNSRLLALSGNGSLEKRFDNNGIGFSILGNFGQGAPAGKNVEVTAQNIQGRARYERFLFDELALFLINTVRHDRFQGLDVRYNLDPGVKYLFLKESANTLWAEAGYDFQYDVRRNDDRVKLDADKKPVLDATTGQPQLLDKTFVDHSSRLFVGFKHGFNKEVTLATGLEYLQSVVDSSRNRLNYDLLFAAKVGGGLAVGLGVSMRYDHSPLPGKEELDTSTTVSLIYAFSDIPDTKPKTCPCPEPAPPITEAPPSPPPPPPIPPAPPVEPPVVAPSTIPPPPPAEPAPSNP